jgi:purine-binding chemotaxis protein CheW
MIRGRKKEKASPVESLLAVEFMLIPEKYAFDSIYVSEVMMLHNLTTIPGTPSFIVGIMNVRGSIISVIDLKIFFNLPMKGISSFNKLLIVKHQQMEFGIITDEIVGTRQIDIHTLSAPPGTLRGVGADFIQGITPDGTILLNASNIFSDNSLIINQK